MFSYTSACGERLFDKLSLCINSVEVDISSERGSVAEAIPIRARQAAQSSALPPQGVRLWHAATQV